MIVITKRVSLDFLGDEYKDSYLDFRSMTFKEVPDIQKQAAITKESEGIEFLRKEITERFISGKISQNGKLEDVTIEDLGDLPLEVYTHSFQQITGTAPDPKS